MKNPYNSTSIFRVKHGDNTQLIIIGFSRSGTAYAFNGYSDMIIGKAGGYGYDKEGAALQDAINTLYPDTPGINGAAGSQAVKEHYAKYGILVSSLSELVWTK